MEQNFGTRPATLRRGLGLFGLALLFTLLNAFKPLTMDDAAYRAFAGQMARQPLDPYGFEIFWFSELEPAFQGYTPPVYIGWLALGIRLFGERPFLWKLWTLPVALLLTFSVHALARRLARGLEIPLTVMTVLSPSFLPSANLMLDVPCVALGLTSLALFFQAIPERAGRPAQDRTPGGLPSLAVAVLAGIVAGLAFETKYSGVLAPAALFVAAVAFRQPALGSVALVAALGIIGAIEGLLAWKYGNSLFLAGLALRKQLLGGAYTGGQQAWALFSILGGLGPAVCLLGWAGLRGRVWAVAAGGAAVAGGIVYLAGLQGTVSYSGTRSLTFLGLEQATERAFLLSDILFVPVGLLIAAFTFAALCRLSRVTRGPAAVWHGLGRRQAEWFLLGWITLEVVGYFVIAPTPGARRLLGVIAAVTLLLGRLASRTCRARDRAFLVRGVARFGVLLALGFYTVDWWDARAQQEGPGKALGFVREADPDGKVWYLGHWGFQYYADQLGMRPMMANRSQLALGDWLVVPDETINKQVVRLVGEPLQFVDMLPVGLDPVPYRTVPGYYNGTAALEGRIGPRYSVVIFRVVGNFTARWPDPDPPPEGK